MDPLKSQKKFIKENKAKLGCSFDKQLLADFKEACKILGVDQTPIIVETMQITIDKAKVKNH